jgi:hypothetical protein
VFFPFKAARIFLCSIRGIQSRVVKNWVLPSPCIVRGRFSDAKSLSSQMVWI